ncbi:MAG: ROK family protein [Enterocloster clostridioformis]
MNQIGTYLGRGISYCISTILNTQAVVIGGGVAASLDLLLPSIRVSVQQNAFKQMQDIDIVKTPLGYEAALLGAAALVLEQ